MVVLRPDKAMVVGDDGVDDGQPQTRPRLLGGKVGLEEPGAVFGDNAVSGIGDGEGGHLQFLVETAFDGYVAVPSIAATALSSRLINTRLIWSRSS